MIFLNIFLSHNPLRILFISSFLIVHFSSSFLYLQSKSLCIHSKLHTEKTSSFIIRFLLCIASKIKHLSPSDTLTRTIAWLLNPITANAADAKPRVNLISSNKAIVMRECSYIYIVV